MSKLLHHNDYTVAVICPMGDELSPVLALLDEVHESLSTSRDQNAYMLGKIGQHNVVVAGMPEIGNNASAMVVTQLLNDFGRIRFGLLVGIGGGIPDEDYDDDELNDIRLGDVVVSHSRGSSGGVVQFDRGKITTEGFVKTGYQSRPPHVLAANVETLRAAHNLHGSSISRYLDEMLLKYPGMKEKYSSPGADRDSLFQAGYAHEGGKTCKKCDTSRTIERDQRRSHDPRIHYGTIGSSNVVIKDTQRRDELRNMGILCVEMEAAGLMEAFPCLVIRGISDYADSHKNNRWQPFAAATAAAYMKELLSQIPGGEVQRTQTITDALDGLARKVDQVDCRTRRIEGQTESATELKVLKWLSSEDTNFSRLQNESQQAHTVGTGQWLLNDQRYRIWRDHEPGLLWLHGVAGCGKTILCSTIIRDLQENFQHVVYWYFRFDNNASQDISKMLRSLIRQLSFSPLPGEIQSLYDRHSHRGSDPSLEELITALDQTIEMLAHDVYIVFDALDECPWTDRQGQRNQLLQCIERLRENHPNLHVLVTSRPEPDIRNILGSIANCDFDIEQPIKGDVERYVKLALEEPRMASWPDLVKAQIREKLLEYEERQFRWADLQIKRFAQCPNMQQLKAAMASIPKDLEAAYRQAFDAIDENNTMYVSKIMMWLAVSLQPLDANQIAAIVGFRDSDYVLQICSTLLVTIIDEDTTKIIKLAHFSVKEFLVIHLQEKSTHWYRFTTESANSNVASLALDALLYSDHQLKPILAYAAQYWPRHATDGMRAESHMELEEKICLLLDDASGGRLHDWLAIHDPDNIHGHQNHRRPGALYYASLLGFEAAVSKICGNSPQSLRNEGKHGNALNAAAILGNVAVVRWMLRNCPGSSESLDIVRVAGEINANVTECFVELLSGPAHLVITKEVVEAAAENEGSGQEVMKALLDRQGNEFQITERVLRAAAGNWDSGQQVMALLLKRRADEVLITEEVVKTAFGNQYSGQQVMRAIFEHKGSQVQMTENVIKAAIESGQSGQEVMELLLERRREGSELQITEQITCLIAGNFNASTMRLLLERRGDEVHVTEAVVKAAAGSYLYAQQVMEVLLERRKDQVQLTEEVVQAAAGNKMSGKQALKAILEKKAKRNQITESVVKLIAGKFDADTTELLLRKAGDDLQLTEEVFEAVMSNEYHAQGVMEVLLQRKPDCCDQITEPLAKAAATNSRSGRQVMELLLANKEHPVSITESAFITSCCHWNREDLMELVSERLEADSLTSRLQSAIILRNTAAVQALLKRGTDPNQGTHRGRPLFLAESYGNTRSFELLLLHGAQLSPHQKAGSSMCVIIARGFTGIAKLLLENGADPQKMDGDGWTPLNLAISKKSVDMVQLLLEHGADPMMAAGNTWMPLLFAIDIKSAAIVQILLEHGADPQQAGVNKCTPLTAAVITESVDIIQLLLKHGADPMMADEKPWMPLLFAIDKKSATIVQILLEHGADPQQAGVDKCTPLTAAVRTKSVDIIQLLLERGADPTEDDLRAAIQEEATPIVEILLRHGADPTFGDEAGVTHLHYASSQGLIDIVKLLLKSGADPSALDNNGETALTYAWMCEKIDIVKLFLEHGTDINIKMKNGVTMLGSASFNGMAEVVNLLLARGADPTIADVNGDTPLHLASLEGHIEVVRSLDEQQRGLQILNRWGETALDCAVLAGHSDVVDLLRQRSQSTTTRDTSIDIMGKPLHRHVIRGAFNKLKTYWSAS